ncbi:hypothetical protein J4N45_10385 [Vibrio sp. SCSIO 43140]|uniref:hypothetical protein n=1 Tax=Vibrio sp. SCSIO 43140 TaxID=2819100 RepID=UPI00207611A5|nr:hypothetical protein [Vibrio sp. SCSIO 43140]USD58937.1 hypothetical protein J4N45_10385 [Vibrio sp. SCSIO 43140]
MAFFHQALEVSKVSGFRMFMQGVYATSPAQAVHQLMAMLEADKYTLESIPFDGDESIIARITTGEFRGLYDVEYSLARGELTLLEQLY